MRIASLVVVGALLCTGAPALAKETAQSVIEDAKALEGKGDVLKTAARFGDAVALAQAAGDLDAEDVAAGALDDFWRQIQADTQAASKDRRASGAVLAAVMARLDPDRCGAMVSAPVLARNILMLAVETDDFASIDAAAKVLDLHARKPASGRAAPLVARFAAALKPVAVESEGDQAPLFLNDVATEASQAGWLDLATHAATESAVRWLKAGRTRNAAEALAIPGAAFLAQPDLRILGTWENLVRDRMSAAPPEVLKVIVDLRGEVIAASAKDKRAPAGVRGGAGSSGRADGELTELAKLLPAWPQGKPVASAKRTPSGFEVEFAMRPGVTRVEAFREGVHHAVRTGIRLGFHGRSAGLALFATDDGRGGFGGSSSPSAVRAYYLLAEGETWNVAKDGIVTITR